MSIVIGNNIKRYRKELGLTQSALADYLKINRVEVNYYENGKRDIPVQILESFSNLVGIKASELLEDKVENTSVNLSFIDSMKGASGIDIKSLSEFKLIISNYLKIQRLYNDRDNN